MPPKDGRPRGRMSSYAFFVQTCREEHKKKHPGESVVFAEFSKKCSEKWKAMVGKEKKRFEDMAEKDRARYESEMKSYGGPIKGAGKRKRTKDPNAPKRALSGFFFFCHEERPKVKAIHPTYGVGDIAKELGKRWEVCPNKSKFEAMAAKDKQRYEKEIGVYKASGGGVGGAAAVKKAKPAPVEEEDDEDDEEEEDDESD